MHHKSLLLFRISWIINNISCILINVREKRRVQTVYDLRIIFYVFLKSFYRFYQNRGLFLNKLKSSLIYTKNIAMINEVYALVKGRFR